MNGFTTVAQFQWSSGKTKTSYDAVWNYISFKQKTSLHKIYLTSALIVLSHNDRGVHSLIMVHSPLLAGLEGPVDP